MKVPDLGCGDGTTALPAAQLGVDVLGVDIASNLVAAGHRRALAAGVAERCRCQEGDACDLAGLQSKTFDRVVSVFGAMFAPKPFDVARARVRVTRPGGRILGNWIPNGPTLVARILKTCAAYTPHTTQIPASYLRVTVNAGGFGAQPGARCLGRPARLRRRVLSGGARSTPWAAAADPAPGG